MSNIIKSIVWTFLIAFLVVGLFLPAIFVPGSYAQRGYESAKAYFYPTAADVDTVIITSTKDFLTDSDSTAWQYLLLYQYGFGESNDEITLLHNGWYWFHFEAVIQSLNPDTVFYGWGKDGAVVATDSIRWIASEQEEQYISSDNLIYSATEGGNEKVQFYFWSNGSDADTLKCRSAKIIATKLKNYP